MRHTRAALVIAGAALATTAPAVCAAQDSDILIQPTTPPEFSRDRNVSVREPAEGCVGGTGFGVKVTDGGETTFSLHASVCGGANSDAARRVRDWVQPVRTLLPSLDELAP